MLNLTIMDPGIITIFVDFAEDDNQTDTNYSYAYSDEDTDCRGGPGLRTFRTVLQPVLYGLIFLLGVAGNGLMVTVLLTRRGRQLRVTEIYLLHLAAADLLLLLTLPFDVAGSAAGWLFGGFVCKLVGLLKNLNLLCGSFLIACIGFDRYLAIVHAVPSVQSRRPRVVHLTCLALWIVCLGLSLPNAVFLSLREDANSSEIDCSYYSHEIHAHNWVLTKRLLHHVCFFLPLAVMTYCYTALAITLCKSPKSQTKKGAIRLVLLVTFAFCFCWLPYNVALLVNTLADLRAIRYESCESFGALQPVLEVTESLGIAHCCLNPFLYAFVGVRFHGELIRLLGRMGCARLCLRFGKSPGYSPSTSDGASSGGTVL